MQAKVERTKTAIKDSAVMDGAIRFILQAQIKDRTLWRKFCEVFTTHEDVAEEWWGDECFGRPKRWRGEYFGKQMRGAVLVYKYSADEELYAVLTDAVEDLLRRQDALGRFSTYPVDEEFNGWDMWCRKYVLVGLLYYHEICKDEGLKARVISACKRHLDYIVEKIGDGEGQKRITETSGAWGCVNSCTILEPTVELYKRTGEARYLEFAKYILSTGGSCDCNLLELALENKLYPYQYPVVKAYEMMSFYEGVLAYYEITGEERYLTAVQNFIEAVAETDLTIIGCSGCTHELFDHSTKNQTEPHEDIMQETCVTVTWMRVLERLYRLTGEKKYIDRIEISGYNALYGALNTEGNKQLNMWQKTYYDGMAFDSYSPLYMNARGRGIGGQLCFASGGYYGCCLAIGACGIALMPLTALMQGKDGVYLNMPFNGSAQVVADDGKTVALKVDSRYPADGETTVTVLDDCTLTLRIRKPAWCEKMTVNQRVAEGDGYYVLQSAFKAGESVQISMETTLKAQYLNGKIAFTYGAITLASDEWKAGRDLQKPVSVKAKPSYKLLPTEEGELIRIALELDDGETLILTDYQSCGKKWLSEKPMMTAWFNRE